MTDAIAKAPRVIVLAGPNGAGKSTYAPLLLRGALGVNEFVNADVIAQGLSGFNPAGAAIQAGRIMLARLDELARMRADFAFETTLASRGLAPRIADLRGTGYTVHLVFLFLRSADLAVERVADRVRMGGHDVPNATVRRRYERGLQNFFSLYQPLTTTWRFFDNSARSARRLLASGSGNDVELVRDTAAWNRIKDEYGCT